MTITNSSHQLASNVYSNTADELAWVDVTLGDTLLTIFISTQNMAGVKEWAAELLKMCVAVERGELARVETQARHAVAKTNHSADEDAMDHPEFRQEPSDPPIYTGIIEMGPLPGRIDVATGLTSFEDDDVPF